MPASSQAKSRTPADFRKPPFLSNPLYEAGIIASQIDSQPAPGQLRAQAAVLGRAGYVNLPSKQFYSRHVITPHFGFPSRRKIFKPLGAKLRLICGFLTFLGLGEVRKARMPELAESQLESEAGYCVSGDA